MPCVLRQSDSDRLPFILLLAALGLARLCKLFLSFLIYFTVFFLILSKPLGTFFEETAFLDLLNDRECAELALYTAEYERRWGKNPCLDANAVFFLGDNTRFSYTWSSGSGALPTFRRQSGKFWIPSLRRWMLTLFGDACNFCYIVI